MKILVTGARGMVGQNFLEAPAAREHLLLTPPRTELDLLDPRGVKEYLQEHRPDLILHAAGVVGGIQANLASPVRFLVANTQMGFHLLSAAQSCGIERVLNLGSSCMYPRSASNPLMEEQLLQGELEPTNEGYALAKCACARLCEYIARESPNLRYKTLIPCNLYGRYDKFEPERSHLIAAVIRKVDEAKREGSPQIIMWGDGSARREFMYAADFADFLCFALDRFDDLPQNLNVGLGRDYSIDDYYRVVVGRMGFAGSIEKDLSKPVGMKQKLMDSSRLNKLGWFPKTTLERGIEQTLQYFQEHRGD